jgi:hypothetical protein
MARPAALAASLCLAGLLFPPALVAQAEFAAPVPRGVLRVNFTPLWLSYDHRFGQGTPGYVDGAPEPIGVDFSAESLGVASLPVLGTLQDQLRAVTGIGDFTLNLGRTVLQLNASVRTLPIGVELGLSSRLAIGVTVPIVRSRVDAYFVVDTAAAKSGNVGFADPAAAAPFRTAVTAAVASLQALADTGPPALRARAETTLAALQPFVPVAGAAFLPLAGSVAGDSITSRLDSAQSEYGQLAAQYAALGVTLPALTETLDLPGSPLGRADLERFFSDAALPMAADTLGTVVRTGIGDVTAHATFQFADGGRYRGQLVLTTRFPTGSPPSPNNYLDLGTGTHQFAAELALANDLQLGSRFLVHSVARIGAASSDKLPLRVTPPNLPMAPASQLAVIRRKPSPYLGVELAPTWLLDDAFSMRVTYGYFDQGTTRHSYANPADSLRVLRPASVLDQETAARVMRIGAGITFSTLSRYLAHRASLPYSVTVSYANTVWGRGGRVPQLSEFRIRIRAYVRVF